MPLYQSKVGLQTINEVLGIGLSHRLRVAQSHGLVVCGTCCCRHRRRVERAEQDQPKSERGRFCVVWPLKIETTPIVQAD